MGYEIKADPSHVFDRSLTTFNGTAVMCACGARIFEGRLDAHAVGHCALVSMPKQEMPIAVSATACAFDVLIETARSPELGEMIGVALAAEVDQRDCLELLEDLETMADERTADETSESREYLRRVQRAVVRERARLQGREIATESERFLVDEHVDRNASRKTVVFDFDGVLCQYAHGWRGVEPSEPPVVGALTAVQAVQAAGYVAVVVSSRARHPDGAAAIERWLAAHGFPPLYVTDRKVPAVLYVDDRGLRFAGDFAPLMAMLSDDDLMPWERRGVVRRTTDEAPAAPSFGDNPGC